MGIEREVTLKLRLAAGGESQSMSEIARHAERLKSAMPGANEAKAIGAMVTQQSRMAEESKKTRDAITGLVREYSVGGKAAKEMERVTKALMDQKVEAGAAAKAVDQLFRRLGEGAKVSNADIERLGRSMRSMGMAAATPTAPGGLSGMLGTSIGNLSVGRAFALQAGSAALQGLGRGVSQALQTPADSQINELMMRRAGIGTQAPLAIRQAVTSLPVIGPILDAGADIATFGSRNQVVQANERLARQRQQSTFRRERDSILAESGESARRASFGAMEAQFRLQTSAQISGLSAADQIASLARGRREQEAFRDPTQLGSAQAELGNRTTAPRAAMAELESQMQFQQRLADIEGRRAQAAGNDVQQRLAAIGNQRQALQQLEELERRRIDVVRQAGAAEQERLGRFREFAQQSAEHFRQQAQGERDRIQGMREQFGSMNELERAQALAVSRRVRAGGQLTSEEEAVARRNPGLFENPLRAINNARADQGGFQEIVQNLGVDQRQRTFERQQQAAMQFRAQIENRMNIEIRQNEGQLAQQLVQAVMPRVQQNSAALMAQVQAEMERRLSEFELANRAQQ